MMQRSVRFSVLLMILISGLTTDMVGSKPINSNPFARSPHIGRCSIFPDNNIWNTDISNLPVNADSAIYISSIGINKALRPYFGATIPTYASPGMPFIVVPGNQPKVPITFDYANESDPGPYPIPANVPIEGGSNSVDDRHVIVLNSGSCMLYETGGSYPESDGTWHATGGSIWNLNSNNLRPASWTSADAAGLPILPGLVRYNEIAAGAIHHALRFTVTYSQSKFLWPARHFASLDSNPHLPPMGLRFRLKADVDISGFSPTNQIILTALKHYGMIVADNGPRSWVISGAPDNRWNNDNLAALTKIHGSDFEAIDESTLQISPDSGQVNRLYS